MPQRAFEIRTRIDNYEEPHTIFAESAGKARYETLLNARDAGYDQISFQHIRVRSLGVMDTPREIAERKVKAFNDRYPVGTPIKVYPGPMWQHETAYDTEVRAPCAHLNGAGHPVVKVPGDTIAIDHVIPLAPAMKAEAA